MIILAGHIATDVTRPSNIHIRNYTVYDLILSAELIANNTFSCKNIQYTSGLPSMMEFPQCCLASEFKQQLKKYLHAVRTHYTCCTNALYMHAYMHLHHTVAALYRECP